MLSKKDDLSTPISLIKTEKLPEPLIIVDRRKPDCVHDCAR